MTDMTSMPTMGLYLIKYSYTFDVSRIDRTFTTYFSSGVGIVTGSTTTLQAPPNGRYTYDYSCIGSFSGIDQLRIYIAVSNTDTYLTIHDQNLLLIPLL
jgi:hypothetical protein